MILRRAARAVSGPMMTRRLVQLYAGLVLYGFAIALGIRADLGLDPWGVFHQGVSELTGLTFGTTTILVGALVLALWLPLRQKPGLGTVSNILVIGVAADASLALLPEASGTMLRLILLGVGIFLTGVASAAYIGAGLGPGPRDGLMTGIVARTGWSVGWVRTAIEIAVLAAGWLLGGTAGLGTILYAVTIGPIVGRMLPFLTVPSSKAPLLPPDAAPARES